MPELPEVETIRQDLETDLVNRKILAVNLYNHKTAKNDAAFFVSDLENRKILSINRRGKLLMLRVSKRQGESENKYLLIHLKMTGQLILQVNANNIVGGHSLSSGDFHQAVGGELPNKYTRCSFKLSNKATLYFNDLRKFGYLKIVEESELKKLLENNYGPEPGSKDLNVKYLSNVLKNRQASIKSVLLNQKLIAGLGNIYVDEALFFSGIRPDRIAKKISKEEVAKLIKEINKVIAQSIKNRGTTFSNYVDSSGRSGNFSQKLKVYGRAGETCYGCGVKIVKIKTAQRGTHYCPNCQK